MKSSPIMGCAYLCCRSQCGPLNVFPWSIYVILGWKCVCVIYGRFTKAPFSFSLHTCVLTHRTVEILTRKAGSFCTACPKLCKADRAELCPDFQMCARVCVRKREQTSSRKSPPPPLPPPRGSGLTRGGGRLLKQPFLIHFAVIESFLHSD